MLATVIQFVFWNFFFFVQKGETKSYRLENHAGRHESYEPNWRKAGFALDPHSHTLPIPLPQVNLIVGKFGKGNFWELDGKIGSYPSGSLISCRLNLKPEIDFNKTLPSATFQRLTLAFLSQKKHQFCCCRIPRSCWAAACCAEWRTKAPEELLRCHS